MGKSDASELLDVPPVPVEPADEAAQADAAQDAVVEPDEQPETEAEERPDVSLKVAEGFEKGVSVSVGSVGPVELPATVSAADAEVLSDSPAVEVAS